MSKKRILILTIVMVVLAALVYLQFREWRRFDWGTFARVTANVRASRIAIAIGIIYLTYILRGLRWKIFLRPVCKTSLGRMLGPQFVGFTGLALLGRPGELIRPYLIAKKENLTVSSQVAVWAVERIFDIGAFAVLMAIDVFASTTAFGGTEDMPVHLLKGALTITLGVLLRIFGVLLILAVGFMAWLAYKIRRNPDGAGHWVEGKLSSLSKKMAHTLRVRIRSFGEGLNTVHDRSSFIQLVGISLLIWFLIALAYRFVLHAYSGEALHGLDVPQVLLLMGASMVGSLLQLPAVGGGSQLAVISAMVGIFAIPKEQAVSAGIMLWLVTFVACVPVGLVVTRFEHVSLRRLTAESQAEEKAEEEAVDSSK